MYNFETLVLHLHCFFIVYLIFSETDILPTSFHVPEVFDKNSCYEKYLKIHKKIPPIDKPFLVKGQMQVSIGYLYNGCSRVLDKIHRKTLAMDLTSGIFIIHLQIKAPE